MRIKKSRKKLSAYRSHMGIREGLSFSDYFDDSVPYEVKPVPSTIPMEEDDEPVRNYGDDYPLRAKDLFKGLWESSSEALDLRHGVFWLDKEGNFYYAGDNHKYWAAAHLDRHRIPYRNEDDLSKRMFEMGFIRVSSFKESISSKESKKLYFEYDKQIGFPNERQMAELKNAAMELGYELLDGIRDIPIKFTESLLFKDILKEQSRILPSDAGYWMDPLGKFYDVGIGSHLKFSKDYMASKNLHYFNERDPYEPLLRLGFIRIITDTDLMIIRYLKNKPPTNHQWKILKDTAIESKLVLYDETVNKTIDLTESLNLSENSDIKDLFIESMMPKDMDTFKSHLAQLFAYLQKELQLKTVPKVKLLSDEKNASKVLGKTAYYDPDTRTVNLYITDRHQKDILRSFSHEVVHHWQHENERLQTSCRHDKKTGKKQGEDPQYAQHNPWLRQMEKQAYLLGNMLFRDWEDEKKAKDRKSSKKMVEKTYLMGKEYPPKKMNYSG